MLEAKLWHNKTKTKNVKVPKMVEFIKPCDQYPRRFNFGNFFNSIILFPRFCWWKNRSSENAVREEWAISLSGGNDKNLQESLAWGHEQKWTDSVFWLTNVVASITINLKLFCNHAGIYRFRKKIKKDSGEINPLGVHRNMKGCIFEVYCEWQGW